MRALKDVSSVSKSSSIKESQLTTESGGTRTTERRLIKKSPPEKKFSDSEIRNKSADKVDQSNSAKTMNKINHKEMLGSGFLNEEVVTKKIQEKKIEDFEAQQKAQVPLSQTPKTEAKEALKTTISVEKIEKPSDVGVNDPKDPMTSSKLKSVLDMGAFNFNPKERDILAKILSDKNI